MRPSQGVPTSPITGVPGWETNEEERALIQLANRVPKGGTIVELGSEYGRSAAAFAKGAGESVQIYSFDLFPDDHPEVGRLIDAYKVNLTEAGFMGRTQMIRFDSAEGGHQWKYGPVHLLFIDADHSYEGALRDAMAWSEHVALGGVIAFHDCAIDANSHPLHHEVNKAIHEWRDVSKWQEMPQVDSLRIFRRVR